ncbi:MAG: hypothetical protein WDM80_17620 [Limisphaerales bacterium]
MIIFVLALPFVVALGFLIANNRAGPSVTRVLPDPNGYEKFLEAGKMLEGDPGAYETMDAADLTSLVASNTTTLNLVRAAFTNKIQVPVQFSTVAASSHTRELISLRKLALTLTAEGRLAELNNRPEDAARDYLEVIHFGNECGRGGLMIDALIGVAIEGLGQINLQRLTSKLDAASCRKIVTDLELLDGRRQAWTDVMEIEIDWQHRTSPGLKGYLLISFFNRKAIADTNNRAEKAFFEQQRKTRKLMIQFAARAYELEKGKPATNIAELVPTYLKTVPRDPVTGKDMIYPL